MSSKEIAVAAIQLDTRIGENAVNLAATEKLATEAIELGAKWIGLPEFFNTGVCWDPDLVHSIEDESGPSLRFLQSFSEKHQAVIGGSIMCRISDGSVRNRYFCFNRGDLLGYHDKDLPTMWENAFYEGGDQHDTGELGVVDGARVGTAMCWEFLRTQTTRRLRGKVDIVLGGTHWWSIPSNWPRFIQDRYEPYNEQNVLKTVVKTAKLLGVPVVNASHCNTFSCPMPGMFTQYEGHTEGNTAIVDGEGKVLAKRDYRDGSGVVLADVQLKTPTVASNQDIPDRFWLRRPGPIPIFAWHYQRLLGRAWYKKYVKQHPKGETI